MSFSITNNSANAVVTKIETLSSTYGSFTVTSGSFPLLSGDTISGTNTEINNQKGSPDGSILLMLVSGNAQIEYYLNGVLISANDYSSGLIEIKGPIIQPGDVITINVDEAELPVPSPTPSITPSTTPGPTPSMTPSSTPASTPTPTPSSTPSVITPSTLGAQWWIDFTDAASLTVVSTKIDEALDQIGNVPFTATTTQGPVYDPTGYLGLSGTARSGSARLRNALGEFTDTYSEFTWFAFVYDDVVSQRGGKYIETYDAGFPTGTEGLGVRDDNNPPTVWLARARNTAGGNTEVTFDHTYSAWTAIAVRAYNSGGTVVVEAWENNSILNSATQGSTSLTTKTDVEYSLMFDGGINYCTEQFFFDSKLSDVQMGQMFQYLTDKY